MNAALDADVRVASLDSLQEGLGAVPGEYSNVSLQSPKSIDVFENTKYIFEA